MARERMDIGKLKGLLNTFGTLQTQWKTSPNDARRKSMEDAAKAVFEELKKDFSYVNYVSKGDLLTKEYVQRLQLAIRHYAWQHVY